MVENVGGHELEVEGNAFIGLDVLRHSDVHVYVLLATNHSDTASAVIQAEDRVTYCIEQGSRIGSEDIELTRITISVQRSAIRVGSGEYALFVGEEVGTVDRKSTRLNSSHSQISY